MQLTTKHTTFEEARDRFGEVVQHVERGDAIVVIQRPKHPDVAMIAADELSSLLEEVYLLRSPANAKRLFDALEWSEARLSEPPPVQTLDDLRAELESELGQVETAS